nr:hypothetical protein BaRGS_023853 [Batillaria attramentaria]
MGCVPDVDLPFDLLPVDYCAKAVVEIAKKCITTPRGTENAGEGMPVTYHLYNQDTIPFKELFAGSGLRTLPFGEWRRELKRLDSNPHLTPLTPFFLSSYWDRARCFPKFCTCNTEQNVSPDTAQLLKSARQLLTVYNRYFGIET